MKKIFVLVMLIPIYLGAEPMCNVKVCNKLERFTLSPSNWISDKLGEQCYNTILPKSQAKVGKVLASESRWYQGSSINPTKKSVTQVKEVYNCK